MNQVGAESLRAESIHRLQADAFDLLVVGGGATGSGVALDAALRGLRVALVEKGDFGSGTSSRSTKLIHGGVRYLEQAFLRRDRAQLNLVREALRERAILLRIAPHLAHPLQLVTPLYRPWEVPYYWTGLKLYDLLAGPAKIGSSRFLSPRQLQAQFPKLQAASLLGGVLYADGQFDDARMNLALTLTAVKHGATVVNYAEVTQLIKHSGRIAGAAIQDRLGQSTWEVRSRVVVNAAGPFADHLRRLDEPEAQPMLRISAGAHVVVDGLLTSPDIGLLIPRTEDGRVLFVLPWLGSTLIGTTDVPAEPTHAPRASPEEIDYLLRHVANYLEGGVAPGAVKAVWSGLRPLVAWDLADQTSKLSRDHRIYESASGLVTIVGGKWTTYRKMGQDAVDYAIELAGIQASAPSSSDSTPLIGAHHYDPHGSDKLVHEFDLEPGEAAHLHRAYGDRAPAVAALAARGMARRLAPSHPFLEAEVAWAARAELAHTAMDVLARRTRLSFLDQEAAVRAVPRVIEIMGTELGWDLSRRQQERSRASESLELSNSALRVNG